VDNRTVSGIHVAGLAILVESLEPSRRQLLLEFAIDRTRHGDMPQHQRFRIHRNRLAGAIQNAIDAGWDPESVASASFMNLDPCSPLTHNRGTSRVERMRRLRQGLKLFIVDA